MTDMSNEIYPLEKDIIVTTSSIPNYPTTVERTVSQRLVPIFAALADDPDEWEIERYQVSLGNSRAWGPTTRWPTTHEDCDTFRLVPKRKTITVEIPVPDHVSNTYGNGGTIYLHYDNKGDSDNRVFEADELIQEALRSAMEGE